MYILHVYGFWSTFQFTLLVYSLTSSKVNKIKQKSPFLNLNSHCSQHLQCCVFISALFATVIFYEILFNYGKCKHFFLNNYLHCSLKALKCPSLLILASVIYLYKWHTNNAILLTQPLVKNCKYCLGSLEISQRCYYSRT